MLAGMKLLAIFYSRPGRSLFLGYIYTDEPIYGQFGWVMESIKFNIVFYSSRIDLCRSVKQILDQANPSVEHIIWPCSSMERLNELTSLKKPEFILIDETTGFFDVKRLNTPPPGTQAVPRFLLTSTLNRERLKKALLDEGYKDAFLNPLDISLFIMKVSEILGKRLTDKTFLHSGQTKLEGAISRILNVIEISEAGCEIETDYELNIGDVADIHITTLIQGTVYCRVLSKKRTDTPLWKYTVSFLGVTPEFQATIRRQILLDHVNRKKS